MNAIHRSFATTIACVALVLPLSSVAAEDKAAQQPQKERVVIQVSDADPQKWNLALNNAKNVQTDLGADKTEIEIVAYGPGIGMLKADALVANRVEDAVAGGVRVVACENTMKALKISRDDMNRKVDYVAAGVVELMRRQQQGYAYIRP
ncbi:MAG: DsrE family protein [Rhodocyclales bacterium]|nr:DsrE family protein [Rhodocyclales bacterium]